ncbi:hypothetical protein Acr_11g0011170 [Actinidia rufa]|uniref:CCHC-type domain-containing protein n=1 Tax=Actinidia rufa TaxID=165716 RepID=A0A7J0FDP8_9ERIC|nr:hypothetical protein Acr_11g0011170 [Actinidia rufa]
MDQNPLQNMEGQEAGDINRLPIQIPNEALVPQGRYMQDYLNPTRASTPSCIVLPANAHTFTIKPVIPHHGYDTGRILSFFYEGIAPQTRQFINMMYNGQFMRKSPEEALDFFDELVENNQSWDFSYSTDRTRSEPNTFGHGKYQLKEQNDLQTKYDQLSRKLESLEIKKIHEVSTSSRNDEKCIICERSGHLTSECPTVLAFKEVLQGGDQVSVNAMSQPQGHKPFNSAYSNTYNPGWRNHPNFSWRNTDNSNLSQGGQTPNPPPQQASPMGLNPYGNQNQGQTHFQQAQYPNHNHNQNVY